MFQEPRPSQLHRPESQRGHQLPEVAEGIQLGEARRYPQHTACSCKTPVVGSYSQVPRKTQETVVSYHMGLGHNSFRAMAFYHNLAGVAAHLSLLLVAEGRSHLCSQAAGGHSHPDLAGHNLGHSGEVVHIRHSHLFQVLHILHVLGNLPEAPFPLFPSCSFVP